MQDAVTRASARIARGLAKQVGESKLPCPVCTQAVKGANLDKHLVKVHDLPTEVDGEGSLIRGSDALIHRLALLLHFGGAAATLAILDPLVGTRIAASVSALVFFVGALPVGLAFAGRLPASVRVDADGLLLTRTLGLRRRLATFPMKVETGALLNSTESGMVKDGNGYRGPWRTVKVGSYVGLVGANGVRITLGAKRSTRPLAYWGFDHVQGRPTRSWDIHLEPEQLVQLQYLLSEQGVFRPKEEDSPD